MVYQGINDLKSHIIINTRGSVRAIFDRAAIIQERLLFKKHFLSPFFAAINQERLLFESDLNGASTVVKN